MKSMKWLLLIATSVVAMSVPVQANEAVDRSYYELLIDRYNNGTTQNDRDVNHDDEFAYQGGDFIGVSDRVQHVADMNFTTVLVGNVFDAERYDGKGIRSYERVNEHFGTEEELRDMVEAFHKQSIEVVIDVPLIWKGQSLDEEQQRQMIEKVATFIESNDIDGVRFVETDAYDVRTLEERAAQLEQESKRFVIIADERVTERAIVNEERTELLQQTFAAFNEPTDAFVNWSLDESIPIALDTLEGERMTKKMVDLRMFPPTRWHLAATALFTLPGTPVMTYGSEIALNNDLWQHPIMNFKTEMELKERIGQLNDLRNRSKTLRTGEVEWLHTEGDYLVWMRSSDDERWIVALNNSDETRSIQLTADQIGDGKKMRGLLQDDLIRQNEDGTYYIVLTREMSDVYYVEEDQGYNVGYIVATASVVVGFTIFLVAVLRRSNRQSV